LAIPKLSLAQRLAVNYYRARLNLIHVLSPRWAANEAIDLFTRPYANTGKWKQRSFSDAEGLKLLMPGHLLHGYRWKAAPDSEKRILLIHGFSGSVGSFYRYVHPLMRLGYDVYAYDAPAHGRSQGKRLSVLLYEQAISEIREAHGPFDGFVAHSLGGLSLMMNLHSRPADTNARVVLIAPATESKTAADHFFSFLQLPPSLRRAFENKIAERAGNPIEWYSISRVVQQVPTPILWVHDENDDTTPIRDVNPILAMQPPHVEFHITRGLGHSRIYKDNNVRRRIVRFFGVEAGAEQAEEMTD
jgi:pimeloyl-ACP methyl ester carboxylesterase